MVIKDIKKDAGFSSLVYVRSPLPVVGIKPRALCMLGKDFQLSNIPSPALLLVLQGRGSKRIPGFAFYSWLKDPALYSSLRMCN